MFAPHPKISEPIIDFKGMDVLSALGKFEERTRILSNHHVYFSKTFKGVKFRTLAASTASENHSNLKSINQNLQALHIYKDCPINLRINVVSNPLMNAEILAQYVARKSQHRGKLPKIFQELVGYVQQTENMGSN